MNPYGVCHLQNLRVKPRAMGLQAAPFRTQLGVFSIMGSDLKGRFNRKKMRRICKKRDRKDNFLWKMDLFRSWAHFEDLSFWKKPSVFKWSCSILLIWKLRDELELKSLLETAWQKRHLALASDFSIARAFLNPRCSDRPSWGDPGVGASGCVAGRERPMWPCGKWCLDDTGMIQPGKLLFLMAV